MRGIGFRSNSFVVCLSGEFLFLVFGIYLCYKTRAAPSDYMERRYISLAIYNETFVSALLHITR